MANEKGIALALSECIDIDLTGIETGDILEWDGAKMVPVAPGGGDHPDLAAHNDLGLATQDELDAVATALIGHHHDATYVNEADHTTAAHNALGIDAATLEGDTSANIQTAIIAAIVNAAPSTLDTLVELAAALGDDPDFATTITALIGTKATVADAVMDGDAAGGVLSGTFPSPGFASDMATQAELDAHKSSGDHDGRYYTEAEVDDLIAGVGGGGPIPIGSRSPGGTVTLATGRFGIIIDELDLQSGDEIVLEGTATLAII